MKKIISSITFLIFTTLILQHCAEEPESAAPEKVQFTCSFTEAELEGGRTKITEIPAVLELSVTNSAGLPVFDRKRIPLIRTGDGFMTEPLELTPSSYLITHFMLLSETGNTIYLTPFQGSQLGKAVKTPLPHPFMVSKNKVSNITMEVIDLDAWLPQDFGYAAFPIVPVNPLEIGVFIPKGNGVALANAKAIIVEGDDTVKQYNLGATINLISFPGDPQVTRRLIVTKAGYNTVVKEFAYDSLALALQGLPLKIMLVPAVFEIKPFLKVCDPACTTTFQMTLLGMPDLPGNLSVDWGDGTSDTYTLSADGPEVMHDYGVAGDYHMVITGDLDRITYLSAFYGLGAMKTVNLQGLTALREIRVGWTDGPEVIDFSQNVALDFVYLPRVLQLRKIILPEENVITYLNVTGPNQLTPAEGQYILDHVSPWASVYLP